MSGEWVRDMVLAFVGVRGLEEDRSATGLGCLS